MKRAPLSILVSLAFVFSLPAQVGDPRDARWIRLTSSDFDLYTCGAEKEGRDLLQSFEQIRGFFQKASPVPALEDFPVRVVAFSSRDQFSFYAPGGRVVAYYAPGTRTDYIVMRDATRDSYAFGIHEYIHLLIRHSGLHIPIWLNEGWADVYSSLRPVHDGVAVGDLIPGRVKTLESSPWLDLATLTSVNSESSFVNENQRVGVFYAESWALVHMLFLSPEYSAGFPKFLSAMNRGRPAAEAFQTVWNRSADQVFSDLQNYLKRRKIEGRVFEVPLGKSDNPVEISRMEPFDTRLMLADLTVSLNRRAEAKREYEALAQLQPNNTLVNEALGFAALAVKDDTEARENFEKAFAAGDANPLMCLQLALLEGRARQPKGKILMALNRALQSKPDYLEAQFQLGLYHLALREYQPAIDTLLGIKKVSPERATPVFSTLAYCHLALGELDKARADALTAKQWARDPRQTATEDQLLAMIEAREKSPFAPKPGEKIERVDGLLKGVECEGDSHRLQLTAGGRTLSLDLPDIKAIEFAHSGPDKNLTLSCGPQQPDRLIVDFAPASVMKPGSNGVVRRVEY
jgi:tetratricopeptide (TPR) repeat protein